jgi:hypothetical protein
VIEPFPSKLEALSSIPYTTERGEGQDLQNTRRMGTSGDGEDIL